MIIKRKTLFNSIEIEITLGELREMLYHREFQSIYDAIIRFISSIK